MADKPKSPAAPPRKRQIVIITKFANPFAGDPRAEIAAMKTSTAEKPTWLPSVDDFEAVMLHDVISLDGTPVPRHISTDCNSFFAILQGFPVGSLFRVHVLTHSDGTSQAVGGTLDRQGKLAARVQDAGNFFLPAFLASTAIGTTNIQFLNNRDDNPQQNGAAIRDDIRTRFDPQKGEIIFYGCDGATGAGVAVLTELSRCLNVNVRGFKEVIEYRPVFDEKAGRIVSRNLTRYEPRPAKQRSKDETNFRAGFLHLKPDFESGRPSTPTP
jgi:hypothetical protein